MLYTTSVGGGGIVSQEKTLRFSEVKRKELRHSADPAVALANQKHSEALMAQTRGLEACVVS